MGNFQMINAKTNNENRRQLFNNYIIDKAGKQHEDMSRDYEIVSYVNIQAC
jgi:hypothetical protein